MEMDDTGISVNLPTERPLHHETTTTPIDSSSIEQGRDDFDASALVSQLYVDREVLVRRVLGSMGRRAQVGLREVVAGDPLEQGLAELVGYLSLAEPGLAVVFDEHQREQVVWSADEVDRVAELPRVSFSRYRSEDR
jgi:hypothetical protein